jgi:hypothetical protein
MKALLMIFALALLAGCTREDQARQVLQRSGYKDIQITGYSWFACGKDDSFATGFRATAPDGETIEGTVCAGFFKGATVRL